MHKDGRWFYIDARGVTSSFNEFMDIAKVFVSDEYTIKSVDQSDIDEWKKDDNYYDEAVAFSEAIIDKYKTFYSVN